MSKHESSTDVLSPFKCCTKCNQSKPRTEEYFPRRTRSPDGLRRQCRVCRDVVRTVWRKANPESSKPSGVRFRQSHPTYQREWRAKNHAHCLETKRVWRQENGEKEKAQDRDRRRKDPEKAKARDKRKHETFRARRPEYGKELYRKHAPKLRQRQNVRRAANPEFFRAKERRLRRTNPASFQLAFQRRRARKQALPDTLTLEQWAYCKQYWAYSCAYCGREEGFLWMLAMDHFVALADPSCPGTTASNIVPACHGQSGCNLSKGSRSPVTWLIEKLGKRKAAKKLKEIAVYFALVATKE